MSNNLNHLETPREMPIFEERITSIGSELVFGITENKLRTDRMGDIIATRNNTAKENITDA